MSIQRLPENCGDIIVLVVEDDPVTRDLILRILAIMGATTIVAEDGSAGLRAAHESVPHLIITDLNMEPVCGMSLLGGLRASVRPDVAKIPVLMFTAERGRNNMDRASDLGIEGYIIKPFTPQGLSERICTALSNRISAGSRASKQMAQA